MTSYELFEKLLNERGVKAADVHRGTGIATSTLTEWKKGKYEPKTDKLQKIADYFNVPLTYFTEGENPPVIDAKAVVEQLIAQLGSDAQINFSADDMPEDEKEIFATALNTALEKVNVLRKFKQDFVESMMNENQ